MDRRCASRVVITDKRKLHLLVSRADGRKVNLDGWVSDLSNTGIKMYFGSKLPAEIEKNSHLNCDFKDGNLLSSCSVDMDVAWLNYVEELDVTYIGGEFIDISAKAESVIKKITHS